jgi:hypothetical protein
VLFEGAVGADLLVARLLLVADTSAVLAVLFREPEWDPLAEALGATGTRELRRGVSGAGGGGGQRRGDTEEVERSGDDAVQGDELDTA